MKTGLGLNKKLRFLITYVNLFRFWYRKTLIGFDVANQFIKRVDKISLKLILLKNGASIGENSEIETGLTFHNCDDYSNLIIGDNCHIGKNCFFDLKDKIKIENSVTISMQSTFITHIDVGLSSLKHHYPSKNSCIIIKDNSYIGARTIVLAGVVINSESFVAAATLVNRDVPAKSLVAGTPFKIIKSI